MASAGRLIVYFRVASVVLGVTALVFVIKAADAIPAGASQPASLTEAHQMMGLMLSWVTIPWGLLLLVAESCLVNLDLHHHLEEQQQNEPPSDVKFLVTLIMAEWLLTYMTIRTAFPAFLVDLAPTTVSATYQLVADVTAGAAGALAGASAVGLLWVVGSRLHRAQA